MLDVNSLLCVTSVLYLSNVLQMSLKKIKTVLKNREKRLKALYIIINTNQNDSFAVEPHQSNPSHK